MQILGFAALGGVLVAASNVTFFGAPRFSLGDTLPLRDSHGDIVTAHGLGSTISTIVKPSCAGGTSANSRSVAYYQEWNIRTRPCDKVRPSQIKLDGLTQLNLAFASIDPTSFKINLQNPGDEDIYREFVELKQHGLKVWLGVGGWEFNDEGPTRTTWSELASRATSRKAFIDSSLKFLEKYGFQGLDIDWEWPASASRGGRSEDTQNQVTLMKELRTALGTKYGLTCVLPHDSTFLQGIDVKGLSAYVDWFNILTYDLHGSWDKNNPSLGARIRPHTDLEEIDSHLETLWATGVDPAKFTLGLAYYGRGYTASDTGCLHPGCSFSGPSTAGNCTTQAGVLSGCEIKRIIKEKALTPGLIEGDAGAMQLVWDNQWIGYDNDKTFALKKKFANDRCMGGTAVWAIDYDSCDGNGELPPPANPDHSSTVEVPASPTASSVFHSQSSNMAPSVSKHPSSVSSMSLSSDVTFSTAKTSSTVLATHSAGSSFMSSSAPTTSLMFTGPFPSVSSATASSMTSSAPKTSLQASPPHPADSSVTSSFGSTSSIISTGPVPSKPSLTASSVASSTAATSSKDISTHSVDSSVMSSSGLTTSLMVTGPAPSMPSSTASSTIQKSSSSVSFSESPSSPKPTAMSTILFTLSIRSSSLGDPPSTSGSMIGTTTLLSSQLRSSSSSIEETISKLSSSSPSATHSSSTQTSTVDTSPESSSLSSTSRSRSSSTLSSAIETSPVLLSSSSGEASASETVAFIVPPATSASASTPSLSSSTTILDTTSSRPMSAHSSLVSQSISAGTTVSSVQTLEPESYSMSLSMTLAVPTFSPKTSVTSKVIDSSSDTSLSKASIAISSVITTAAPWTSSPTAIPVIIVPTLTPKPVVTCTKDCDPNLTESPKPTSSDTVIVLPIVPWIPDSDCPPNSPRAKAGKHRGFFGCGCGWSGLDKGPGCPKPHGCGLDPFCWIKFSIDLLFFKITLCGPLFECDICKWVGGCPNINCGIMGCDGYCHSEWGCDPDCPKEICGTCIIEGKCPGIKPGPPPGVRNHPTEPSQTPETTRKPDCQPKDYVTATEVFSLCAKKILPVSVAVNSSTTTTISTCSGQSIVMTGCPPMQGMTTTEWQTLTEAESSSCTVSSIVYSTFSSCLVGTDSIRGTQTSSCASTVSTIVGCDVTGGATKTVSTTNKPGGCSLAPLIWGQDEGDNTGLPRNVSATAAGIPIPTLFMQPNATSGGSCGGQLIDIDEDEGDNAKNMTIAIPTLVMKNDTSGGSCPWSALIIDDDEGDNLYNDTMNGTMSIPFLSMKSATMSIPTLTMESTNVTIPTLTMKWTAMSIPSLSIKSSDMTIPSLTMKPSDMIIPTLTKKPSDMAIPTLAMKSDMTIPTMTMKPSDLTTPTSASASSTAELGPKPIQAGGKWEIKIEHFLNRQPPFQWELLDSNGNQAGVGAYGTPIQCFNRPPKDCFPFDIEVSADEHDVKSQVDFQIMMDLPSGRRLKFDNKRNSADLPEDGYPDESYGCRDDDTSMVFGDYGRTFWCAFQWLGAGGWDGETDSPVPNDL